MKTKLTTVLPLMMVLLAACYPNGPEYVEDADVVASIYDTKYDFKSKSTFAMPDKIVVDIKIDKGDTTYEYMAPKFATVILEAIQTDMENLGWERVDLDEDPDLVLTPAGTSSTTYFYSYWYNWWYGGYGGWYGWYYPPYYTVSSYTAGTLVMVLVDPSQAADSPINRSQALWVAAGNGLLTGAYDITRVTDAVHQAFAQSPYLKTN
jgi:predicted small lipoprotein YifL